MNPHFCANLVFSRGAYIVHHYLTATSAISHTITYSITQPTDASSAHWKAVANALLIRLAKFAYHSIYYSLKPSSAKKGQGALRLYRTMTQHCPIQPYLPRILFKTVKLPKNYKSCLKPWPSQVISLCSHPWPVLRLWDFSFSGFFK